MKAADLHVAEWDTAVPGAQNDRAKEERCVGDDCRPVDDRDGAVGVRHCDRIRIGPFLGIGVSGADGERDTVGRTGLDVVGGGQDLWVAPVSPVDDGRARQGCEIVDIRTLVIVGEGPQQHRAGRVTLDAGDLVAGGAIELGIQDGDAAARRAGQRGDLATQRGDDHAQGVGQARRRGFGVGVAAEDLEDRLAVGGVDAALLDGQADAGDGRRAVAPAADGESGVDVGDGRQRVGVLECRQNERAGVLALDRVKLLVAPVTGRSVITSEVVSVIVEPPSSKTLSVSEVGAGLGVGVTSDDVEYAAANLVKFATAVRRPVAPIDDAGEVRHWRIGVAIGEAAHSHWRLWDARVPGEERCQAWRSSAASAMKAEPLTTVNEPPVSRTVTV